MKRNTQSATRSLGRSILALAVTMLAALSAHADTLYWDTNGDTTLGAGTTPDGTWVTSGTSWNTGADGDVASDTWANNDYAVFSAGTDATEATITVDGLIYVGDIHFDEGSYTMVGSTPTLNVNSGAGLTVDSDASVLFDSSLPVKLIDGGTRNWTINGEARFEGTVTGDWANSTIQKYGSGTLVFDGDVAKGANYAAAKLEVYAGTAIVNGSWDAADGRFDVYGGTLGGTGTISVSQYLYNQSGGTIAPGDITGDRIGTLNVSGNVGFSGGSTVNFEVGTTADKLDATAAFNVWGASTANVANLGGIGITQNSSYTLIEAGSTSGMDSLTVDAAAPWTATKTGTGLEIALNGTLDRGDFNVQGVFTEFDLTSAEATGYIDLLGMQTETAYGLYLDIEGGTLSNLTDQLDADGITWSTGTGEYELLLSLNSGTTTTEYLVWDFSDIDGSMTLAGFALDPALIPEPASFVLLGLGVLALMRRPRRRRTA